MRKLIPSVCRYGIIATGYLSKDDWIFIITVIITILTLIVDYLKVRHVLKDNS